MAAATSTEFDDGASRFLDENGVREAWRELISRDDMKYIMDEIISKLTPGCLPERKNIILRALTFCDPCDIKVVILSQDPIPDKTLATGLAFSAPRGVLKDSDIEDFGDGYSFKVLHEALKRAQILDPNESYDCCHEEWAEKGVLLLNASLTHSGHKFSTHFDDWRNFTQNLLLRLMEQPRRVPLFILCWGTNARQVGQYICEQGKDSPLFKRVDLDLNQDDLDQNQHDSPLRDIPPVSGDTCILIFGHHPTYPRSDNKFIDQAARQFKAIQETYPDFSFSLSPVSAIDSLTGRMASM